MTRLMLSSLQLENEGLRFIQHVPALRELIVTSPGSVDASSLPYFSGLVNLETLTLYGNNEFGRNDLGALKALTKLRSLDLGCVDVPDDAMGTVGLFTNLESLQLDESCALTCAGYTNLRNLTNLRDLSLRSCSGLNNEAVQFLRNMT